MDNDCYINTKKTNEYVNTKDNRPFLSPFSSAICSIKHEIINKKIFSGTDLSLQDSEVIINVEPIIKNDEKKKIKIEEIEEEKIKIQNEGKKIEKKKIEEKKIEEKKIEKKKIKVLKKFLLLNYFLQKKK
jgi:translation initiation factor IF-2